MLSRVNVIKSYGEYIRKNPLRNKRERINILKLYLDLVYRNKDKNAKIN